MPTPPARLYNLTGPIRGSGGAIICFVGPPHKAIDWRMVQGLGTLTPYTLFTNEHGQCSCRFDSSGIPGRVIIGAAYVP